MAKITVDFEKKVGKIRALHAVGQPPLGGKADVYPALHFHYLTEAGIPYSRLHDVGGYFGGNRFVDIPNIFRDFDADVEDPASYDFVFTDRLISGLIENGIEPYYRLGVTIENFAAIKQYRQEPPKDFEKWASIAEHIAAHYMDGWADGFHYKITYWEIMNEPDSGHGFQGRTAPLWWGTPEQYYALYDVTAKKLKARFGDRIKVGGYAATGFYYLTDSPDQREAFPIHEYRMEFFKGFMNYVKAHGSPLDFFSWHSYQEVENTVVHAKWLSKALKEYGFDNTESHLNEWNVHARNRGTGEHAADVAAMMLALQRADVDVACIYDARLNGSRFATLFNPLTEKPWHAYYCLVAFHMLYKLGQEAECISDSDGVYAIAATDGNRKAIMISNISGEDLPLVIENDDLGGAEWNVIDDERLLSWSPAMHKIPNNTVVLIRW